ncbi:hypothetical protein CHELA1G11_14654 [Hyphomicrobiales bacterium]|nr:hypothetical protein CHELA1G2_14453 [Hyphomicrobiales bacterium]CAH1680092.1 hypothetical protein CHELA1G11_14654 [Hyphomicrobiales bacterium]
MKWVSAISYHIHVWVFSDAAGCRRPIREITAPEILETLRRVEVRGRYESARRLRSIIGSVFRYAVATARADNDPTFALRGALTAPQTKSWAALTEPRALGRSCGRSTVTRARPQRQPP